MECTASGRYDLPFADLITYPVANVPGRSRRLILLSLGAQDPTITYHSMAENKTKPSDASVAEYIASRANEQRRSDCLELMALFKKVTGQSPKMWGPSIVGYDSYRYIYESGRTGEAPLAGFAIRGRELVVYLSVEGGRQKSRNPCYPSLAGTGWARFVCTSGNWRISTSQSSSSLSSARSRR